MLYLVIGITVFVSFLLFIKWLSAPDPEQAKNSFKYTSIIIGIILVILLFRFGQPFIAAALGAIMAAIPYFRKIIGLAYTFKTFRHLFNIKNKPAANTAAKTRMSRKEACEILGVTENASPDEIKQAYQKLMKRNHPDTGGSKYLASQLNMAKDILLG